MDAHVLLSPVGQKTETRFNCLLTENRKSTEMMGTPSTVCVYSFHRCGGPPPSKREVWGLRAPSRRFLYNSGCRVETLLVSMGVMGFLGERVHSFHRPQGGPPPSRREVWGLRAHSRIFFYCSGSRVATLLVSKGVMGFLGDLREDRSRARPVGGSARRSIPSERKQPCCDL